MARKNQETPLDKIVSVRSRLDMFAKYGDVALRGQSPQDFAKETLEAFNVLMELRNMVNTMVALREPPAEALVMFVGLNDA